MEDKGTYTPAIISFPPLEFLRNINMYEDVMQQKYKTSCKILIRMLRLIRIDKKKES